MIRADDALTVLDVLAAGVAAWVDGGRGTGALLGRTARDHADVDPVVPLDRIDAARAARSTTVLRPWLPTALAGADADGRAVNVYPVVHGAGVGAERMLPDGGRFAYGTPGTDRIGGRAVRRAATTPQGVPRESRLPRGVSPAWRSGVPPGTLARRIVGIGRVRPRTRPPLRRATARTRRHAARPPGA